ncbi:MAG: cytochrome c biogenesis protein CcsA [Bacteroidota bacterium]
MNTIIDLLTILLPVFYALLVWLYAKDFFRDQPLHHNIRPMLLIPTITIHFLYLILRTIAFDHMPITTIFEIMSIISFGVAVVYVSIEYVINVKGTGVFVLFLSFLFQIISSFFIEDLIEVKQVLRSRLLGTHVTSALIGYVALAIAAMYGFLYIMLYHNIKAKRFNTYYLKLPNLEILERMTTISITIGFIFLGIAIAVGIVWLPSAFEQFSYFDPKLVITVCIWILFGVSILAKRYYGLRGRRFMMLAIVGFMIAFFSLTIGNLYFTGFHNFY